MYKTKAEGSLDIIEKLVTLLAAEHRTKWIVVNTLTGVVCQRKTKEEMKDSSSVAK